MLIIYFAGFATAIYTLAPPPESDTKAALGGHPTVSGFVRDSEGGSRITSKEFIESFNAGMHKCIDFGKEAACRTAKFLKKKYKNMRDA